jgi:hypothetical protein
MFALRLLLQNGSLSFPGVISVYEKAWVKAPVPPAEGWSDEDAFAAARARCVRLQRGCFTNEYCSF